METNDKEVDFYTYCPKCKSEKTEEKDDPCYWCLNEPVREGTSKPSGWAEKES